MNQVLKVLLAIALPILFVVGLAISHDYGHKARELESLKEIKRVHDARQQLKQDMINDFAKAGLKVEIE